MASFPIPLASALAEGKAIYVSGASSTHCSGIGHADPGYLCLYQGSSENLNTPVSDNVFNAEDVTAPDASAGAHGFAILLSAENSGLSRVSGRFAAAALEGLVLRIANIDIPRSDTSGRGDVDIKQTIAAPFVHLPQLH